MGRSQGLTSEEQADDHVTDDLCCSEGVSRVWNTEDPEPKRVCPAAKCCGHLTSKVYVGNDLTVYEICVSELVRSWWWLWIKNFNKNVMTNTDQK